MPPRECSGLQLGAGGAIGKLMLPALRFCPPSKLGHGPRWLSGTALLALLGWASTGVAAAQDLAPRPLELPAPPEAADPADADRKPIDAALNPAPPESFGPPAVPALGDGPVAFEADGLSYDSNRDVVTASGNVVLRRGGQSVRADAITWDRNSGQIVANGNIRFVDADGNQLFTDTLELTDEFKAGAMDQSAAGAARRRAARGRTR